MHPDRRTLTVAITLAALVLIHLLPLFDHLRR